MIRLLTGDCRDMLATLPDASVQMCVTSPPYFALRSYLDASHPDKHRELGSEPTPEAYLATMVQVFREVRRVLRDDGTCWVNMGDSYCSTAPGTMGDPLHQRGIFAGVSDRRAEGSRKYRPETPRGLKPKDLLMMPARLALALQADGWWLRSDIIWAKPNPMPESVTDRCVSAHEHIFMLTKKPRYFFDNVAIAEPAINAGRVVDYDGTQKNCSSGDALNDMRTRIQRPVEVGATRSCRNVWTLATEAFPAAHFATFPSALAERCIRAGTSERGCCAQCGKPWVRQTEAKGGILGKSWHDHSADDTKGNAGVWAGQPTAEPYQRTTTGWAAGCQCNAEVAPCVVLDCFSGAGTALLVADRLGRDAIGIDLSHAYVEMARERLQADCPLFADINAAPVPEPPEDERMADLFAGDEYQTLPPPKPMRVPAGWDTGPGAHGTIHRTGRTLPEAAE